MKLLENMLYNLNAYLYGKAQQGHWLWVRFYQLTPAKQKRVALCFSFLIVGLVIGGLL